MCKMLVDKDMLIKAGFPPYTASSILRQAKHFRYNKGMSFMREGVFQSPHYRQ
ncbi:DUF3173 family protein [Listeria monocytogenes]|nr:DUF3173 family protein [Listeria monocytogenes]EIV7772745.1 DUF3173 family protein [Listeria monocytogenes]EJO1464482.1 DUF3173 family protein [Listeria monocytogenes]EJO1667537.1 DUF3173 family protein [Listeria monocytogenes]EJS5925881.1 DUF3173 family protein [Listeria monocytogenes]